jgi:hypothetical protein
MKLHTHVHSSKEGLDKGFAGGAAFVRDPEAACHPARSSRMLLEAGLPYAHLALDACWGHQGLVLSSPDATCARGCAKTGPVWVPNSRVK